MEIGDIVTVKKGGLYSNTCLVAGFLDNGDVLLTHPSSPECFIKQPASALNLVPAIQKNATERCLDYAAKNKALLNFDLVSEIDALGFYFLVNRQFSKRQKKILTRICGHIASVACDDLLVAIKTVNTYKALLDAHNSELYAKMEGVFSGLQFPPTNEQKFSVFNLAGFILAQLETK